ncbi:hyaluronan synthase [Kurthia sp. 3B1D]|uniref:Hyaluronan synthase n=1 Tax=Candidatus Kurthia intestinigallinarum TaxID=1562256 RepID=A0A433RPS0_9BACL|nr:glycosyltransferase [Kurthia sp. 3B1D]RUS52411.1 hyaluronan synthase [Kurthia sp. 3B1D]
MIQEVLTLVKKDRRKLSNIPDPHQIRHQVDRRGISANDLDANEQYVQRQQGQRYVSNFPVKLLSTKEAAQTVTCLDISNKGMLVRSDEPIHTEQTVTLKFKIDGGVMPEGYEARVSIRATPIRAYEEDGDYYQAFEFEQPLNRYMKKRRWGLSFFAASLFLLFCAVIVLLMRTESVLYFKFNKFLYLYSLIAATFLLSRYVFGLFYRNVPINPHYEPGVTIIIPAFNEEQWIHRTITTCVDQDYPIDKLEIIVVDDCSTDETFRNAQRTIQELARDGERFQIAERLQLIRLAQNSGKREALVAGVEKAKHELIVFVDSDSFLEPNAIRNIVQPFQDPKMGGVSGRTEVENKYTNTMTKLQTVRYYIAFRIMKAAESYFDVVTCLSGPLSCYRKDLIEKHQEAWLKQKFLGHPATFGDDRSMTNYILKTHRTAYQDAAICSTIVPSQFNVFLKQQMRWKRSWLRESLRALTFMWKKEPLMFLFFIVGLIVPIAAPIVVVYNLIYVPIAHQVFPTTFVVGLTVMALLLSFAHLLFRKSTLWLHGLTFVLFYEFVLLWQMPIAWFTFWKSTWGTRDTPQDLEERRLKEERKMRRAALKRGGRLDGEK